MRIDNDNKNENISENNEFINQKYVKDLINRYPDFNLVITSHNKNNKMTQKDFYIFTVRIDLYKKIKKDQPFYWHFDVNIAMNTR